MPKFLIEFNVDPDHIRSNAIWEEGVDQQTRADVNRIIADYFSEDQIVFAEVDTENATIQLLRNEEE